jgi:hypothetical protein
MKAALQGRTRPGVYSVAHRTGFTESVMKMNTTFLQLSRLLLAAILCSALAAIPASAQSSGGPYKISSSVIAGGGGENMTGGAYRLDGTTGQSAAGGPLENIPFYSLLAGFWATLDQAAATFVINGQVTYQGNGLAGVTVRLEREGVLVNVAQTDAAGHYSFAGVEGGHNYSVTPLKDGYVIAPFNAILLNLSGNATANFSVVSRNFKIKGRVTAGGAGLAGVTVSLKFQNTTTIASAVTDGNGDYSFNSVGEGGPYAVEAQKAGYGFSPQSHVYSNLGADQTADFNAALITHGINGRITTTAGTPLDGVTVTLSGAASSSATTDANGQYSFQNLLPGGNYTATPAKNGYTFTPAAASFGGLGKDEAANFTAASTTPPPPSSPSVEFEQAGYSVSEGEHYKLVRVLRSGDASQGASVDYATQDLTAGQRTDYNIMIGTLSFAAGETAKTLTLLVTDDSLIEGPETLSLILSNPSGATLGGQSVAQVTVTDDDPGTIAGNAIDDVPNFVRQQYHDFLNREPEPNGFEAWQEIIGKCPAGDAKCDRVEVSSAFYRSQEFHDRGYFIYRFTAASLGRVPKYLEFMRDMQKVSGFLSAEQQEVAKQEFIQEFMNRCEFKQKYDGITDAGAYVDAVLSTAGVQLPQRGQLVSQLQDGKMTRGQALRAIIESSEVDAKFYNESFVVMQYFGYPRRDPDILYLEWIKILEQTGDYRVMVSGFMNSKEYRERFGQ